MTTDCNNVAEYLLQGKEPESIALLTVGGHYTYGEIGRATEKVAIYLQQIGGEKGDRVVLIGPNGLFWVGCYLGALRSGLICVPLPETISPADLESVLNTTGARIALVQAKPA